MPNKCLYTFTISKLRLGARETKMRRIDPRLKNLVNKGDRLSAKSNNCYDRNLWSEKQTLLI